MKPRIVITPTADGTTSLGSGLRWWRGRRGFSQLDLAGAAETTQRHLSFLESARAGPSREMVLRFAAVLHLPLRQENALLLAAGFAPAWRETICRPALTRVNNALDDMLAQQEPHPAFVLAPWHVGHLGFVFSRSRSIAGSRRPRASPIQRQRWAGAGGPATAPRPA